MMKNSMDHVNIADGTIVLLEVFPVRITVFGRISNFSLVQSFKTHKAIPCNVVVSILTCHTEG